MSIFENWESIYVPSKEDCRICMRKPKPIARGTTPTHDFTLPLEYRSYERILVTYKQDDFIKFEKSDEDITVVSNDDSFTIAYTLTQNDTLSLKEYYPVYIQIKLLLSDNGETTEVITSEIFEGKVLPVLNDTVFNINSVPISPVEPNPGLHNYSAGDGIEISDDYKISVDKNTIQEKLVSGQNIKTINNESLIGEGNIEIQGGASGVTIVAFTNLNESTSELDANLTPNEVISAMFSSIVIGTIDISFDGERLVLPLGPANLTGQTLPAFWPVGYQDDNIHYQVVGDTESDK